MIHCCRYDPIHVITCFQIENNHFGLLNLYKMEKFSASIPEEINVFKLIQSHLVEISSLKKQCKTKQCKQTMQRIPRHMRRRAASNNPKRLPKALQHGKDIPTNNKKQKRRRSHRIATRNKDPKRTLLHMWFTKRFKMELMWGKKIPYKNNSKNQRLLYRCGKKGYISFYLPFLKTFSVNFAETQSKESILTTFTHLCSSNDLQLLNDSQNSELPLTLHVHERDQFPLKLIGPIRCRFEEKKFIITTHIGIYESVVNLLTFESYNITHEPISHIRLYGSKANRRLNRILLQSNECSIPSATYCGLRETNYNKNEKKNTDRLDEDEKAKIQSNSGDDNANLRQCFVYKYLINKFEAIDIEINDDQLKSVWYSINENMAHLVGGLRDLQVLAIESQTCLFPTVGYFDCNFNHRKTIPNFDLEQKYAIRERNILKALSESSLNCLSNIRKIEDATVYVTIEYLRGKPRQNDLIYLPGKELIESYLKGERQLHQLLDDESQLGSVVGFVEYGTFSMEAAKCRAIAVISLLALKQMIIIQLNLSSSQNRLYALIKNEFNNIHLVTVSVIDQLNSI